MQGAGDSESHAYLRDQTGEAYWSYVSQADRGKIWFPVNSYPFYYMPKMMEPGLEYIKNATEGVVFSWKDEENGVVLMNLLSRRVKTTVPQDRVEPRENT